MKLTKTIITLILIILPSAALCGFVVGICNYFLPLFFTLCFGGGVSVVSFVLLAAVFGIIDIKSFVVKAKDYTRSIKLKKAKKV